MRCALSCVLVVAAANFAGAQPTRAHDVLRAVDVIRCAGGVEPSADDLLPGDVAASVRSANAAVNVARAHNRERGGTAAAASAHLRASWSGIEPCNDWTVVAQLYGADRGQWAYMGEATLPLVPFLRAHAGAAGTRERAYDPVVAVDRAAWIGGTLQLPDVRSRIPLPKLGTVHIRLRADVTGEAEHRDDHTTPRWIVTAPLSVFRGAAGVQANGLAFIYDYRRDHVRRAIILSLFATERTPLRLAVRASDERRPGMRRFNEIGVSLHTRAFLLP